MTRWLKEREIMQRLVITVGATTYHGVGSFVISYIPSGAYDPNNLPQAEILVEDITAVSLETV
jgi:hypothetical protein